MQTLILASNIILAVLLIVLITIQRSNTDSGGAFSSESSGTFKRRGAEKTIYRATVLVSILFALSLFIHSLL
jgi:protein translocase SecG subunit